MIQLLKKVRLSTDLWTALLSRSQKKAMKFSKSNVIVQKDKLSKKWKKVKKKKSLLQKMGKLSSTSDSISFSISNTSSSESVYRQENLDSID